jgi:hypothetical protein
MDIESAALLTAGVMIWEEVYIGSLFLESNTLPVRLTPADFLPGSNLELAMILWKRLRPLDPDPLVDGSLTPLPVKENFLDAKLDGLISAGDRLSSSELPPLYSGPSSSLMSITIGILAG